MYSYDVTLPEMKPWYVKLTTFSIVQISFLLHYIPIIESILRNYNIN